MTKPIRRAMTKARKRAAHDRAGGVCWWCSEPVEMFGPTVEYDHRIGVWLTEEDRDDDVWPLHADPCHKLKTAQDAKTRGHVKRMAARHDGTRRPRKEIQSPGFQKGHRPFPKRPFPKRSKWKFNP